MKINKKLKKWTYVDRLELKWCEHDRRNSKFLMFQCKAFFVGVSLADRNQRIYEQDEKLIRKRVRQIALVKKRYKL